MPKICELVIRNVGQVVIWVNTKDHCDPHVHVGDKARSWEARIKFSFVDNLAYFWDCLSNVDPGAAVFSDIVKELITGHLRSIRREWWRCYAGGIGCCMVNKQFDDAAGVARRVSAAIYDPGTNTTYLTFANGFQRTVRL